jgi:hypothetical protein
MPALEVRPHGRLRTAVGTLLVSISLEVVRKSIPGMEIRESQQAAHRQTTF